jgi:hypothetical protein
MLSPSKSASSLLAALQLEIKAVVAVGFHVGGEFRSRVVSFGDVIKRDPSGSVFPPLPFGKLGSPPFSCRP